MISRPWNWAPCSYGEGSLCMSNQPRGMGALEPNGFLRPDFSKSSEFDQRSLCCSKWHLHCASFTVPGFWFLLSNPARLPVSSSWVSFVCIWLALLDHCAGTLLSKVIHSRKIESSPNMRFQISTKIFNFTAKPSVHIIGWTLDMVWILLWN